MKAPQTSAGTEAISTALEQLDASIEHLRTVSPTDVGAVLRATRQGFATAASAAAALARQTTAAGALAGYTRVTYLAASRQLAPRTSMSAMYLVPLGSPPDGRRRAESRAVASRADAVRRAIRALAVELDVALSRSAQLVPEAVHADACRQVARLAHELALCWHAALSSERRPLEVVRS